MYSYPNSLTVTDLWNYLEILKIVSCQLMIVLAWAFGHYRSHDLTFYHLILAKRSLGISNCWSMTVEQAYYGTYPSIQLSSPNLTFYLSVQGFHSLNIFYFNNMKRDWAKVITTLWMPSPWTYATGSACQQRTLTPPDT